MSYLFVFIVIFHVFIIMFRLLNTKIKWNQSKSEENLVLGERDESQSSGRSSRGGAGE